MSLDGIKGLIQNYQTFGENISAAQVDQAVGNKLNENEIPLLKGLKDSLPAEHPARARIEEMMRPVAEGGMARAEALVTPGSKAAGLGRGAMIGGVIGGVAGGIWNFGMGSAPGFALGATAGAAVGAWLGLPGEVED